MEREKLKKLAEAAIKGEWRVTAQAQIGHTDSVCGLLNAPLRPGYFTLSSAIAYEMGEFQLNMRLPDTQQHYEEGQSTRDFIAAANPSTILALLAQLESAERGEEECAKKTVHLVEENERWRGKLQTSEAALRTLRQASAAVSQKVNNAVFVTELKEEINALRLAAEGGK